MVDYINRSPSVSPRCKIRRTALTALGFPKHLSITFVHQQLVTYGKVACGALADWVGSRQACRFANQAKLDPKIFPLDVGAAKATWTCRYPNWCVLLADQTLRLVYQHGFSSDGQANMHGMPQADNAGDRCLPVPHPHPSAREEDQRPAQGRGRGCAVADGHQGLWQRR